MKIGIIADIHGNKESLTEVLKELKDVEQIICLGDIVGYGADPIYCIDKMRELGCLCLKGNHEGGLTGELDLYFFNEYAKNALLWTKKQLDEKNFHYLSELPKKISIAQDIMPDVMGVHGSPREPLWEYILDLQTAEEIFNGFNFKIYFVGHSHVPGYFSFHMENKMVHYFEAIEEIEFRLDEHHSYIVNAGSVGQPRDGSPQASFIIFDTDKRIIHIKRISYPISVAQDKIREAELPQFLAERLSLGM